MSARGGVAGASGRTDKVFTSFCRTDSAEDMESLCSSEEFATLDAKPAASVTNIQNEELGRQINTLEGQMLKGRYNAWLTFQHFKVSETEGPVQEFQDLFDWENCICGLKNRDLPNVNVLKSLFKRQLEK